MSHFRGRFLCLSFSTWTSVPTQAAVVRMILDQKTASDALEIFEWASNLPSFGHSQSTYRALIHKLCKSQQFELVYQLLHEIPIKLGSLPHETVFLTLIRGLGQAGRIHCVLKVLDHVSNFHQEPSLKIYNSILNQLVNVNIDLAKDFYREKMMARGIQGDDYTHGILMKGLCRTNRIAEGFKLLQVMKKAGIKPNTVMSNTLIHALCKNSKVGRARSLMSEMEQPNDVTFNILISAYCNEHKLVQALVLLEKCFQMNYMPDLFAVTKVIKLLSDVGRVNEALEVVERVENRGGRVDVLACNTLIKAYCDQGRVKVGYQFLKEMEMKGCLPNAETYNILIGGFCQCGLLDSGLDIFRDMKTDGVNWNFKTFDLLIRGLCSGGRTEDGLKILELMTDSKVWRDHISPYNSILYGFYKEEKSEEAMQFLRQMKMVFPKVVNRSLRIFLLSEAGNVEDAKTVYDQMIGEGMTPSALVHDCLIHLCCREGFIHEAFEVMNGMVEKGYLPIAMTFNALISAFAEQGKIGSALKLINDFSGRGYKTDTGSYKPVLDVLCKQGETQRALCLFSQMEKRGIVPDESTWKIMLIGLGIVPDQSTWKIMLLDLNGQNVFGRGVK